MKIPITKHDSDLAKCSIVLSVILIVIPFVGTWPDGESFLDECKEFFSGCWYVWPAILFMDCMLLFGGVFSLSEYDVQPEGLYVLPRFSENYFRAWSEFEYVGPIKWGMGAAGPGKVFVCSPKRPYKKKYGGRALGKGTIIISYTPEAKCVLEQYCPIYSTEFENWSL